MMTEVTCSFFKHHAIPNCAGVHPIRFATFYPRTCQYPIRKIARMLQQLTHIILIFSNFLLPSSLKNPDLKRLMTGWSCIAKRVSFGICPSLYFPLKSPIDHQFSLPIHATPPRSNYQTLMVTIYRYPICISDTWAGILSRHVHDSACCIEATFMCRC